MDSISFFSNNFTKKGHPFFKETQSKNWQHFSFKNSAPSYDKKTQHFVLIVMRSLAPRTDSISPSFQVNFRKLTAFRVFLKNHPKCLRQLYKNDSTWSWLYWKTRPQKRTSSQENFRKIDSISCFFYGRNPPGIWGKAPRLDNNDADALLPLPPPPPINSAKVFGPHLW